MSAVDGNTHSNANGSNLRPGQNQMPSTGVANGQMPNGMFQTVAPTVGNSQMTFFNPVAPGQGYVTLGNMQGGGDFPVVQSLAAPGTGGNGFATGLKNGAVAPNNNAYVNNGQMASPQNVVYTQNSSQNAPTAAWAHPGQPNGGPFFAPPGLIHPNNVQAVQTGNTAMESHIHQGPGAVTSGQLRAESGRGITVNLVGGTKEGGETGGGQHPMAFVQSAMTQMTGPPATESTVHPPGAGTAMGVPSAIHHTTPTAGVDGNAVTTPNIAGGSAASMRWAPGRPLRTSPLAYKDRDDYLPSGKPLMNGLWSLANGRSWWTRAGTTTEKITLSFIGVVSADRLHVGPNGSFIGLGTLKKAKFGLTIGAPPPGHAFEPHFRNTLALLKQLQASVGKTASDHRHLLISDDGEDAIRVTQDMFEKRRVPFNPYAWDLTASWPIDPEYQPALQALVPQYNINPVTAFDYEDKPIPVNQLESLLSGATVEVSIKLRHIFMRAVGDQPAHDVFTGVIESLRILEEPARALGIFTPNQQLAPPAAQTPASTSVTPHGVQGGAGVSIANYAPQWMANWAGVVAPYSGAAVGSVQGAWTNTPPLVQHTVAGPGMRGGGMGFPGWVASSWPTVASGVMQHPPQSLGSIPPSLATVVSGAMQHHPQAQATVPSSSPTVVSGGIQHLPRQQSTPQPQGTSQSPSATVMPGAMQDPPQPKAMNPSSSTGVVPGALQHLPQPQTTIPCSSPAGVSGAMAHPPQVQATIPSSSATVVSGPMQHLPQAQGAIPSSSATVVSGVMQHHWEPQRTMPSSSATVGSGVMLHPSQAQGTQAQSSSSTTPNATPDVGHAGVVAPSHYEGQPMSETNGSMASVLTAIDQPRHGLQTGVCTQNDNTNSQSGNVMHAQAPHGSATPGLGRNTANPSPHFLAAHYPSSPYGDGANPTLQHQSPSTHTARPPTPANPYERGSHQVNNVLTSASANDSTSISPNATAHGGYVHNDGREEGRGDVVGGGIRESTTTKETTSPMPVETGVGGVDGRSLSNATGMLGGSMSHVAAKPSSTNRVGNTAYPSPLTPSTVGLEGRDDIVKTVDNSGVGIEAGQATTTQTADDNAVDENGLKETDSRGDGSVCVMSSPTTSSAVNGVQNGRTGITNRTYMSGSLALATPPSTPMKKPPLSVFPSIPSPTTPTPSNTASQAHSALKPAPSIVGDARSSSGGLFSNFVGGGNHGGGASGSTGLTIRVPGAPVMPSGEGKKGKGKRAAGEQDGSEGGPPTRKLRSSSQA